MAYFSNGSEGEVLHAQCAECPIGSNQDAHCPILAVQMEYNYEQIDSQGKRTKMSELMNMLVNDDGECQMLKALCGAIPPTSSRVSPLDYLNGTYG